MHWLKYVRGEKAKTAFRSLFLHSRLPSDFMEYGEKLNHLESQLIYHRIRAFIVVLEKCRATHLALFTYKCFILGSWRPVMMSLHAEDCFVSRPV